MTHVAEPLPVDLQYLIGDHTGHFINRFIEALQPPSTAPIWTWAEANIELSAATSDVPGPIRFDLFPASKFFFNWAQNPRTRRITLGACAQSSKTQDAITLALWRVTENPTPTMWIMAAADQCKEFGADRLFPALESCAAARKHSPSDRKHYTKTYVKFDTMSLFLRGSNSKAKLQSSPIGLIICDERREWKKGSIHTVRKRLTTFADSQEISMGVFGKKGDELHTDWLEGSQTFIHFNCLKCGHSQPWRFGKAESVFFPEPRACGGIVFDNYEITKPNDKWDYDAVEREAKWECENADCRHRHSQEDKAAMIATAHEVHRNPKALPHHYSVCRPIMMLPWIEAGWGKVAVRFLKAMAALKKGDMNPLTTVVTEDFGEPFEPPKSRRQAADLLDRIGTYKLGEYWLDPADPEKKKLEPGTILILTFDRQMMYVRYVVRQWRKNGQSRLVHFGKAIGLDDIRRIQLELRIRPQCTWGDDGGGRTANFRQTCLVHGWGVLRGEDDHYFTVTEGSGEKRKTIRQGYKRTNFDPGIGTTLEGRATKEAFLWSNPWYKDKLYHLFIQGFGAPLWEIPADIPPEYLQELNGNELREEVHSDGSVEEYWHEADADHSADCELMQLVVADMGGLTRSLAQPLSKPKTENKQQPD